MNKTKLIHDIVVVALGMRGFKKDDMEDFNYSPPKSTRTK